MTEPEIEAFFEILKAGSISAAAQNLYVTQPALSRRIRALESELGYDLFRRGKGRRNIQLTAKGEAFVGIAHRWLDLWRESRGIRASGDGRILNLASVGSVSSYILPGVFRRFMAAAGDGAAISFHNYHSFEAYRYVAEGLVDVALISDDMYYKQVRTLPAFREEMVLLANESRPYPAVVSPGELDPSREIRLPWNPEYDVWHDFWFRSTPVYHVSLDQMNLLEYVLSWPDTWAVAPLSVARAMEKLPYVRVCRLDPPPPERIIYYLTGESEKTTLIRCFLQALDAELGQIPGVVSCLGAEPAPLA